MNSNDFRSGSTDKSFTVNGLNFSALCWGADARDSACPIIALHGWLDNAHSFQPLAKTLLASDHLPDACMVSLDLAGHGQSDHRSADSAYNLWQDVDEVLQIADHMGWQKFSLLGHSRGAMISVLLAAVAPERVTRLALVDGLVPVPVSEEDAPEQLAKAIQDKQRYYHHRRRRYATFDAAAHVRTRGAFPLTEDSARLIAQRGVRSDDDGFYWVADPRLQGASDVKFTDGQLRAFLKRVTAPTALFLGDAALDRKEELFSSYWQELSDCQRFVFKGGHHLHMDGAQQQIADCLKTFLSQVVEESNR